MKDEHRRTETAKLVSWSLTSLFRDGEEAVMTAEAAATECNVTRTPDRHEQLSHDTSRRVLSPPSLVTNKRVALYVKAWFHVKIKLF